MQALLVAALFRLDGDGVNRIGKFQGTQMNVLIFGRIVQYAIEFDFIDLGDGGDVAGNRGIDFDMFFALQHEQMADFEGFARVADVKLTVLSDRALMNAEYSELADEGIDGDFEHMGEHMFFWIGIGVKFFFFIAFAGDKKRWIAFQRIRH